MKTDLKKLVSEMTLEEKVSQMLFNAPAIPRLGFAPGWTSGTQNPWSGWASPPL